MAEIIAKLGLDDSKFERGLQGADRKATGILGLLKRKFSGVDLFKDTLRSVGAGIGVGAIFGKVIDFFQHGAEQAELMADHTQRMLDIQRGLQGALGGPRRELELQVKAYNELNRDIEAQKALVESLSDPVLEAANVFGYRDNVDKAKAKLRELEEKQAALGAGAKAAAHAENLRTEALQRQLVHENNLANLELNHAVAGQKFAERKRALQEEYNALLKNGALPATLQENLNRQKALENERKLFYRNEAEKRADLERTAKLDKELTSAELRDASEVEKKQIRLNGLRRDYETIVKRFGVLSNEARANRNQQDVLAGDIAVDRRNASLALGRALAGVGGSIAGHSGGRRGRSERERLADRARSNILRAEDAVLKGQSPDFIASLTSSAARDLRAVGGKIEKSTSRISKEDALASGSSLLGTNSLLKEIRDNLKPTKTNSGGAK